MIMLVNSRLRELRKSLDLTQENMGTFCGISKSAYSMIENGRTKLTARNRALIVDALNVSETWLDTGTGDMFINGRKPSVNIDLVNNLAPKNYLLVPVFSVDVIDTINILDKSLILKHIPFVNAQPEDLGMVVIGNSMSPIFPPGSTILLHPMPKWRSYVEFGQVYLVVLSDGRKILKEIRRSLDTAATSAHFICHSYNPEYDQTELPLSLIKNIYIVKAVFYQTCM